MEENDFPFKLFNDITNEERNVVISPYSISSALSMLLLGCNGKTKTELWTVLRVDKDHHVRYRRGQEEFEKSKVEGVCLNVANRIFVHKSFKLLDKFPAGCKEYYQSHAESLDFKKDPQLSLNYVNTWMETMTESKIKNLLNEDSVTLDTKLVLVNAIYFKGIWDIEFDKELTSRTDFHASNTEVIKVDMMRKTANINTLSMVISL